MPEVKLSLSDFLFFPVALPIRIFWFTLEQIADMADKQMYDPSTLRQKLLELQVLYEAGEVDEEEYRRSWKAIATRLEEVRQLESGEETP